MVRANSQFFFAPPTRARHLDRPSAEVSSADSTGGSKEAAFLRLNGLEREVKQKWANQALNLANNQSRYLNIGNTINHSSINSTQKSIKSRVKKSTFSTKLLLTHLEK